MAKAVFVRLFRNQDGCLDLTKIKVNSSCFDIEVFDLVIADAVRPGDLNDRLPGMQGGSGVGGGNTVACVAADCTDGANLRTADHVDRFPENADLFLNDRVFGDVRKAGQ